MNNEIKIGVLTVETTKIRLLSFIELMKPELTGLSVLTTLCGFYLGSTGIFDLVRFVWVALGTTLVGGGLGALNQFFERHYDTMMRRTERRPLPSGRLLPDEAFWFGVAILIVGIGILIVSSNALTGVLAL
ncbi:MAG: UbiA family prenyltransferase, partial [Bacteroidota bacterium]